MTDLDIRDLQLNPLTKAGYVLAGAFLGYLLPQMVGVALARMFPRLELSVMLLVSYSMYLPALMAVWGRRYLAIGVAVGNPLKQNRLEWGTRVWAAARYRR